MDRARLKAELIRDEGYRERVYRDSLGFYTIGIGHFMREARISQLTHAEIDALYEMDAAMAEAVARHVFPTFDRMSDVRQRAVVNMAFNLGESHLRTFTRFIYNMNVTQWSIAAREMLDSQWAKQVGDRAKRLAQMVRLDVA